MADVGVKGPAQADAPLTYKLADAAEFIPRSIVASFDGTSATSSFYPCLVLKDAGGLEVCRIPTSASVAAGGSAEASWFPGVTPQFTGLDWAVYQGTAIPSIPSDTSGHAYAMPLVGTSNSAAFASGTGPLSVTGPQINAEGIYLLSYGVVFQVGSILLPSNSAQMIWDPILPTWAANEQAFTTFNYSAANVNYFASPGSTAVVSIGSSGDFAAGTVFNAELQQDSGTAIHPDPATLIIVRVNTTEDGSI